MDSFARKKVSSSTLVEVIVAMLIASIVFSFTFSILLNVTGNAPMVSKSCACLVGNSFLEQMKCKPEVSLDGQVDKWQGWFIHKSIMEYKGLVGLRMMEIKVVDANGTEKQYVDVYPVAMKIKAYTIPELIIVMVITSFLVMSLWGGYRFVVKQFYHFNVRTEKYENLMQIDNLLRNDFLKARAISYEQGKRLVVDLKNKKRVQYIFEENVIIRLQDGITDYFNFDIENKQVEYLYIGRNMTSNVISLFIELFVNNRKVDLFYSKSYDRQFYIQSQTSY